MSPRIGVSLAAGCVLFLAAGSASAQYPPGYNRPNYGIGFRPQLNPYLNLANTNNDPGLNYFLHTLPQIDQRVRNQAYNAAIGSLEERALTPPIPAAADADLFTPLPTTGHPVAFGNTGYYFPGGAPRGAAPAYTPPPRR